MTRRMDEIEHTHPHTGEAFGANGGVFARGPAAADGGTEGEEMRDVEHEAPDGDGVNEVWERGSEASEPPERAHAETADAEQSDPVGGDDAEEVTDGDKAPGEVAVEKDTNR